MLYPEQLFVASVAPGYGLTKNSITLLLQQIAKDVSPDKLQIISFHPGMIENDLLRSLGITDKDLPFEDRKSLLSTGADHPLM
jgi:NAD(P)-dependent dehydrogenase (short-subunit alcohol dehydrogenase family)